MKTKIAFFDFDKTLRGGDSMFDLLFWTLKKHPLKIIPTGFRIIGGTLKYIMNGMKNICPLKNSIFSVVRYLEKGELEIFAEEVLLKDKIYDQGIEELVSNSEKGYKVILVSASPEKYLSPLKEFLPIDEVIGTVIDKEGNIIGENCKSFEKVKRIERVLEKNGWEIDYENSKGYSDSLSADGPMLELVKNRYLINSNKRAEGYQNLVWR